jgi:hypothetical protein
MQNVKLVSLCVHRMTMCINTCLQSIGCSGMSGVDEHPLHLFGEQRGVVEVCGVKSRPSHLFSEWKVWGVLTKPSHSFGEWRVTIRCMGC